MPTTKDFKDTAVRLRMRPIHINGEQVFKPPELMKITKTGRKYVFTENGDMFQPYEGDTTLPYFIEHSQYSPDYILFPTVESAKTYIIQDRLVRYIRNAANRLPDVNGREISVEMLTDIARLLGLTDGQLRKYEAFAEPKGQV